ncbi:MAG: hypothetical protein LBT76_01750 [Tannerella sp.]|nr:hypothetical protein [Tannerella sp.]
MLVENWMLSTHPNPVGMACTICHTVTGLLKETPRSVLGNEVKQSSGNFPVRFVPRDDGAVLRRIACPHKRRKGNTLQWTALVKRR